MPNDVESPPSKQAAPAADADARNSAQSEWLKVGAIAAASAVLGGLAAAWFYRKTLSRLREAEHEIPVSEFGATGDDSPEDF